MVQVFYPYNHTIQTVLYGYGVWLWCAALVVVQSSFGQFLELGWQLWLQSKALGAKSQTRPDFQTLTIIDSTLEFWIAIKFKIIKSI